MKIIIPTAVLLFFLVVSHSCTSCNTDEQIENAYELGLYQGGYYTIEYGEMPSMWHRRKMHEYRRNGIEWPLDRAELRKFWDSVNLKFLKYKRK